MLGGVFPPRRRVSAPLPPPAPVPSGVRRRTLGVLGPRPAAQLLLLVVVVILHRHLHLDSARVQEAPVKISHRPQRILACFVSYEPELPRLAVGRTHYFRVRHLALGAEGLAQLVGRVPLWQVLHDKTRHLDVNQACRMLHGTRNLPPQRRPLLSFPSRVPSRPGLLEKPADSGFLVGGLWKIVWEN